ncbi:MAG: hypothetical protein AB2A00_36370 [Myxococcota bacterium]
MSTRRNGGASVFPAEAFKLFRQMAESLKRLEQGQAETNERIDKLERNTTKALVGLSDRIDRLGSTLKQEFKHDHIRMRAPQDKLARRVDGLEDRLSKLEGKR